MLAPLGPINQITSRIIAAAIEVHRTLGPGLLESVYHACMLYEMRLAGLNVESEKKIPVLPVHEAQLMTQLKLANKPIGLLLNFNVPVMKDGITRKLNRQALNA